MRRLQECRSSEAEPHGAESPSRSKESWDILERVWRSGPPRLFGLKRFVAVGSVVVEPPFSIAVKDGNEGAAKPDKSRTV